MNKEYKKVGKLFERDGKYNLVFNDRSDSGDKITESNVAYKKFSSHHEAMRFIQDNNIQLEK
jgi:hypothetical protein